MANGLRHLQAALGVPQTGIEGEEERRLVKIGKCVKPSNMGSSFPPKSEIIMPNSASKETSQAAVQSDRVNFVKASRKTSKVISLRKGICQGDWEKKCSLKTNRPCSWFCTDKKKKARLWS